MKKNVLIWVIIAVVAIAIIVGGYFAFRSLTKKPNGGEGGDENIIPWKGKGNGSNTGGNSGTNGGGASDNGGGSDSSDQSVSAFAKANRLKEAIYGVGTNSNELYKVIESVGSQSEWDAICVAYLELTGNTFYDDLHDEVDYNRWHTANRKNLAKKLNDKGIKNSIE